jgi:hypothetical protein
MLFMVMHKINAEIDAGGPPRKGLVEAMGQLIGETRQAGKFRDGAGLKGRKERVRVKLSGGERTVQKGPYRGENELISSFAMLKVKSMEEGVEWASRYAGAVGATEIEVGQVTEAWDIGVAPKPTGEVPLRVLALAKATASSESAPAAPAAEAAVKLNAVFDDMKRTGVFLGAESLEPSAKGARLQAKAGKYSWTDGPFTESKELVSGYTILEVSSLQEAKQWTIRYATILGDIEVDVREVYEH